jgi:hypothetical protein
VPHLRRRYPLVPQVRALLLGANLGTSTLELLQGENSATAQLAAVPGAVSFVFKTKMTIPNKSLSRKAAGEAVELAFMARAAALGLTVCKPLGDSASYDVVIGSPGSRLLRVQVKSVCSSAGPRYTIHAGHRLRSRTPYTADEIDLLAAWVAPFDTWYIIPVDALGGRARFRVYPKPTSRGQFEGFRERWDLLQPDTTHEAPRVSPREGTTVPAQPRPSANRAQADHHGIDN